LAVGFGERLKERRRKRRGGESGQLIQAVESHSNEQVLEKLPGSIGWLLDAPLFIDEKQVEAFYDAVLRPDFEGTAVTLSDSIAATTTIGSGVTVGAAIPWLVKAEGTAKAEATDRRDETRQASFRRVVNPYRHLVALALHYASKQPNRLVLASPPTRIIDGDGIDLRRAWSGSDFIGKVPRALAMIELPPGTIFIPAALELEDGRVVQLYNELAPRLQQPKKPSAPDYPGAQASPAKRDEYWQWFADYFNDRHALQVVEGAAEQGRIAWIAFRVPMDGTKGPFLHLHIAGRGQYETGVFAYNLINRGRKHGMRLVGTLKTEPDLNVLAIFER
jgi:hypothetical protein